MGMRYLDSCMLIDAMHNPDENGERIRELILEPRNEDRFVISPMVELECMVRPLRTNSAERLKAVRGLIARFRSVEVGSGAFRLAAELRSRHGFKTPDAIHIAAASMSGCDQLWTTDKALLRRWPYFIVNPLVLP